MSQIFAAEDASSNPFINAGCVKNLSGTGKCGQVVIRKTDIGVAKGAARVSTNEYSRANRGRIDTLGIVGIEGNRFDHLGRYFGPGHAAIRRSDEAGGRRGENDIGLLRIARYQINPKLSRRGGQTGP